MFDFGSVCYNSPSVGSRLADLALQTRLRNHFLEIGFMVIWMRSIRAEEPVQFVGPDGIEEVVKDKISLS